MNSLQLVQLVRVYYTITFIVPLVFIELIFLTTTSQPPSVDILESFEMQHPLVLPDDGYQFQLGVKVTDSALWMELDKLKKFISTLSQSGEGTTTQAQKVPTIKGFFLMFCF